MNSGIQTRIKHERLVFEVIALQTLFKDKEIPPTIQEQITLKQIAISKFKKKKNQFNTISCGIKATIFFIKNQNLVPVMLNEASRRHQCSQSGEDMTSVFLENPDLYNFCRDQSNSIYTQNESDCRNYLYSAKYRRIQSHFAWTMEQAALCTKMALTTFKATTIEQKPITTPQTKKHPLQTETERHAGGFYDWRDKNITPDEYNILLEEDHKDQDDDIPLSEPVSHHAVTDAPQAIIQANLPGFEQFTHSNFPKVRKITQQRARKRISSRIRQYGS